MTAKRNAATHIRTGREPPASSESGARVGRRRQRLIGAVVGVATLATLGALAVVGAFNGNASPLTNCAATLASCGYAAATNTGVPAGTTLKTVPGQVSSGPGWSYSAAGNDVAVTGNGAVLSGLYIPYLVHIQATNVTIKNVQVVVGGNWGGVMLGLENKDLML